MVLILRWWLYETLQNDCDYIINKWEIINEIIIVWRWHLILVIVDWCLEVYLIESMHHFKTLTWIFSRLFEQSILMFVQECNEIGDDSRLYSCCWPHQVNVFYSICWLNMINSKIHRQMFNAWSPNLHHDLIQFSI